MWHWLRENAFLAEWLALPIALFAAYAQNRGKPLREIEWNWVMMYATFGITLPIAVSGQFDLNAREFAKVLAMFSFLAIWWDRSRNKT